MVTIENTVLEKYPGDRSEGGAPFSNDDPPFLKVQPLTLSIKWPG
jgi:hypothetical protein